MKPVISIVGFNHNYSNQISELILRNNFAASINTLQEIQKGSYGHLHGTDVAIINGYKPDLQVCIRDCVRTSGCKPPASLIIGNKFTDTEIHLEERRVVPRVHLANSEVSGRALIRSIEELVRKNIWDTKDKDLTLADQSEYMTDELERIGKYRITGLLGKGGMGTVYKAIAGDHDVVAIKLIDTENIPDSRLLDRFMKEYDILSVIEHPHVIQVFDQGFTDNHLFFVMELLTTENLKSKIIKGLTLEESLAHAMNICHALGTIHDSGVLHRDVKPTNILFDENDQPVLTDFGISKLLNKRDADLTLQGEAVGTPAYMSPEQALGNEATHHSDLYAFGIMLFYMIMGRLPFTSKSSMAVMQDHVTTPAPHLPPEYFEIDPIIQQLLSKQPSRRQSSAWEVYEQLDELFAKRIA
jgi:serine/threonine protein kinase